MIKVDHPSEETLQRTIERIWETIPPVWNHIKENVRAKATEKFGISVEQFHILRHIRKGCGSISDLAEVKQISRPAISQAVDVLVGKGLISRQQSTQDRRYVQLELTASGNDLLNAIFQTNRAWMMERLSALDSGEIECILRGMEALKKTFCEPEH